MSDKIANTQDRPEEKPLTEQELQFCNLYVNGGLEYAGRPKKCFVEVFGEDTVKNPYASANYLMNKPHVLAHIKALLSSERFEMETMAVKLQVAFGGDEPAMPAGLNVLHHERIGRVHTYIVRGNQNDILAQVSALQPILLEAIPLTLEEIFIYELGGADYAVHDIVL